MYLAASLENIDRLPQQTFEQIVEKYLELNIARLFREGNGRSMRLWLDHLLKAELGQVVDWSHVDKEDYLLATKRSAVSTGELKYPLLNNQTEDLTQTRFFKGVDASYYYEGYNLYQTGEL